MLLSLSMGLKPASFSFILSCHGDQSSSSSSHCQPPPTPSDDSTSLSSQPSIPSLNSTLHPPAAPPLHHCAATLHGHSSHVSALLLHSNSLFTASLDHHIRVWSTTSPDSSTSAVAAACGSAVRSMAISGDDHLITAHHDRRIRVWKLNQKQQHPCRLLSVLPTPTDRLLGFLSPGKYVQVRRHLRRPWVQHSDAVSAVAVSHDGTLLYSASWDRALKVWRTSDFRCSESISNAHHDAINAVVAAKDGSVYTGSADATIRVWRRQAAVGKHSLVATLEKHKSAVNALAVSEDGSVLYSGACDRSVVVWEAADAASGGGEVAVAGVLRGHGGAVLCVAAAGEVVCSGSADKTVRVWRRGRGGRYSCLAVMEGHGGAVKSLAAAAPPEGGGGGGEYMVYSGSLDCDIKVWKLLVPPMEEEDD